jgi:hypothetical protein
MNNNGIDIRTIKNAKNAKNTNAVRLANNGRPGGSFKLTNDQSKLIKAANNRIAVGRRAVDGEWRPPTNTTAPIVTAAINGQGNRWGAEVYFKEVPVIAMVIRGQSGRETMVKYWNGNNFKYF